MIFKQYYLGCLSQASYVIGDEVTGTAVVVDPRRDVDEYLSDAAASLLEQTGRTGVLDLVGGIVAWKATAGQGANAHV